MNQKQLEKIQNVLQDMVNDRYVSGATCLVLQGGKEVAYYEAGLRNLETREPMTRDTIHRLYSMSKPVTAAAVMLLLEDGIIELLDPVEKYLPGFAKPYVIENGRQIPVPSVTIQQLLNMTSGVSYPGVSDAAEVAAEQLIQEQLDRMFGPDPMTTKELANRLGGFPKAFVPGSQWRYGFSADVLGAVVEAASGMRFGTFLKQRIFDPLGMTDTAFYVPQEKQHRLAKVYQDNLEEYTGMNLGIQNKMELDPAFESGGAGLVSTLDDYAKFTQMLLNKGSYQGVTLMKPGTVKFMTGGCLTEQQQKGYNWDHLVGFTYANLLRIMNKPELAVTLGSAGEYGWDGWLGAYMTNDPVHDLTILMMYQRRDAGTTGYTRRIRNIVYASLDED